MAGITLLSRLKAVDPRQVAVAVLTVAIAGVAVWVLREQLADVHVFEIRAAVYAVPPAAVPMSLLLVAAAYLCLASYDWMALKVIQRRLPTPQVLLTGFTSYAFSNNLGFALLTGGSIRYRAYSALGLPISDIALITVYSHVPFFLGAGGVLAIAGLTRPDELAAAIGVSQRLVEIVGIVSATSIAVYLALAAFWGRPVTVWRYSIPVPRLPIAVTQLVIATLDVFITSAALYLLIPVELPYGYLAFAALTVAAFTAGVASHVPGGLGVIEAVLLLSVPNEAKAGLLAALLLFRIFYYLLPLAISGGLIAFGAVQSGANRLMRLGETSGLALRSIAPTVLAAGTFLAGAVLVFSAAAPVPDDRAWLVRHFVPLPLVEFSHLTASIAGLVLILISRGLARRLTIAWRMAVAVLAMAIAAVLLKGFAWEEAVLLVVALAVLAAARPAFPRRSGFAAGSYTPAWIAAIGAILVIAAWFGFFSYRHDDYGADAIWAFAWDGDAPRFLRAMAVLAAGALMFLVWRLIAPTTPPGPAASPVTPAVRRLLALSDDPSANAVLLGDKRILLTPDESAFLMYQVRGRSWIALGAPVGTPEGRIEAVWAYRELVESYAGLPVFYGVRPEDVPMLLDLGMTVTKYGEAASVPLADFALDQPRYRDFRHAIRRAAREGATFEIVPREAVPALLPELREVSDEWLAGRPGGEKGFSLGHFDPHYLAEFDIALVRSGGRIVAFANIWRSGVAGAGISVDLMRHREASPYGTMDYLFAELMLAAKAEGYERFDLGTAPLSGFEQHRLAPTWHKVGNFIFSHGAGLYNFSGLRAYKEKFHPIWTPRYIALPGGFALPHVLIDCAMLIARSGSGVSEAPERG